MSHQALSPSKVISLEIARFIAAFIVMLEHFSTTIPDLKLGPAVLPPMPASAAVLFFFSLSGFVIYTAHYQDSGQVQRVPRYFWRRFCRIFPLYWLSLVPMLVVLWDGCSPAYLTRILTLAPFTGHIAEVNPPAWTLRYELLFYIIFGLSLLPYARRVLLPAWGLLLAAAWFHTVRGGGGAAGLFPWLPFGVSSHLLAIDNLMFFAGLGAGWIFARWQPGARILWPLLGIGILILGYLLRLDGWGANYPPAARMPCMATAVATVIFTFAALERHGLLRLPRRWALLGAMSYPLYLLHCGAGFIFATYIFYHPAARPQLAALPLFYIMLAIALAATVLVTFLFDMPLQRLARRIA